MLTALREEPTTLAQTRKHRLRRAAFAAAALLPARAVRGITRVPAPGETEPLASRQAPSLTTAIVSKAPIAQLDRAAAS